MYGEFGSFPNNQLEMKARRLAKMATQSKYKIAALVAKVDQLLAKGREQYADTSDDDLKAMIQDGHHEKVMLGMLLEGRRQERLNKKNST